MSAPVTSAMAAGPVRSPVTLHTAEIEVTALPDRGCDIYVLRDQRTRVDVLAKTRVRPDEVTAALHAADSAEAWLTNYLGGWQLILPNGGAAAEVNGAVWGFHGEACLLPWRVESVTTTALTATTRLRRAPLTVTRQLRLDGARMIVAESVTNEGRQAVDVMWSQHPAFGPPFLSERCLVSAPGTALAAGTRSAWPSGAGRDGGSVRLDRPPAPGSGEGHLAYLTDFEQPYFAVTNPDLELGVAFRWDPEVFPHAWYWVEAGASAGFPWFGQHYTLAVEPASSYPAQGLQKLAVKGGAPLRLAAGQTRQHELGVTVFRDRRPVVGVSGEGQPLFR